MSTIPTNTSTATSLATETAPAADAAVVQQTAAVARSSGISGGSNVTTVSAKKTQGADDVSTTSAYGLPEAQGTADDLVVLLARLQAVTQGTSLKTSKSGIEATKEQLKTTANERLEALNEQLEKAAKAAKSGKIGKIFGYIGAALSLVIGALLIASGLGAAAGVALIAVGIATIAIMAVQDTVGFDKVIGALADSMAKSFNLDEQQARIAATVVLGVLAIAASVAIGCINPAGGFAMAAVLLGPILSGDNLTKMGADSKDATWAAMGVQIALAITAIAAGGAQAFSKVGSTASQMPAMAKKIVEGAKLAGGLGVAASQTGSGTATIAAGVQTNEAAKAEAEAKGIAADLLALNQAMESQSEQLKEIMSAIEQAMSVVSDMLSSIGTTNTKIVTMA